jgi:hypothetical protein
MGSQMLVCNPRVPCSKHKTLVGRKYLSASSIKRYIEYAVRVEASLQSQEFPPSVICELVTGTGHSISVIRVGTTDLVVELKEGVGDIHGG